MASTIAWYAFEAFTAPPAEIFVSSKILKPRESSYVAISNSKYKYETLQN